ncbi:S8 family serine peptidase [Spirillospora sp. NPDC052269]
MPHVHPPGRWSARFAAAVALVLAGAGVAIPAEAAAPGPPPPPPTIPHKASPPVATPRPPLDMKSTRVSKTATRQAPATPPKQRQGVVPGQVLVTLDTGTTVTGTPVPGTRVGARKAQTSNAQVNTQLHRFGAKSLRPLVRGTATGTGLGQSYVLQTGERDSASVARVLRGTPGVALAEPDRYVNTMNTGGTALPKAALAAFPKTRKPKTQQKALQQGAVLPTNDTVANSAQAFLNSGGVNAMGAFSLLQGEHGQQPGQGQVVTNVSIGDLTDQSMADAGDSYVKGNGPTTVVKDGQRYLDLPSMPLIPTYVAKAAGGLDATGSTEGQDASLGEVLLDFSVMSPLAHDRQRPGATGSGYTDLLGIAPGTGYRLVVPEQPTMTQLAGTLLAAAHQSPRPNVITASLGFGTDTEGFPGRYLEDDPYIRSVVASIVREGTVVTISSNDGTRLYTPAAVGPDGGSTPTDLAPDERRATRIDDVAESTTPSRVPDSGAIAAGGTTLDDILAAGTDGPATTAETRISGEGTFSSGFGSRVTLSAPSDNILSFSHAIGGGASDVDVSLNGGTSASAPEIAAAAAVVLQAGRISGRPLTPAAVRQILTSTGRAVPTPAQIDRTLQVGPQIDVTAAVQKVLGADRSRPGPQIVRLGVAHRVTRGELGGSFLEGTDQNRIDLGDRASGGDGKALTGPVTFAGDVTGAAPGATYALSVGGKTFASRTPGIRITPEQLLTAAGQPVVSTTDRQVTVTYSVLEDGRTRASTTRTLTVGPSDGTTTEALAPKAPATVAGGKSVTVSYDLTGVAGVDKPQLVVSTVGHWNPVLAPVFTAGWHQELTEKKGTVTIPASAFTGGGGLYGIGTVQSGFDSANPRFTVYGEFAPLRVTGATAAERPEAPLLTGANGVTGHTAEVSRAAPATTVNYDVRTVPGAHAAQMEFATPGPTLYGTVNTFTNVNGTQLDHDGVNSPSAYQRVLHDTHGTVKLDPARLGLTGSLSYGVRVLALDRSGHVIGQASPVSTLAFDDGLPPDDSGVLGFAAAGEHSVAALVTATGTEVRHYSAATGRYGAVITSDPGDSYYQVVGATADRALLIHATGDGKVHVETWNTGTDKLVRSTELPEEDGYFVTGQVDAARSRAALLLYAPGKNAALPIDLNTGAAGNPIPISVSGNTVPYGLLAVDKASGQVYLTRQAGPFNCIGAGQAARVDLDARTVGYTGSISPCGYGAAVGGGKLYNLFANSISVNLVPTATLGPVDLATGTPGTSMPVRLGKPLGLAVDDVHDLAVIAFPTPVGRAFYGSSAMVIPDNDPTGQLAVVDLRTGKTVRTLNGFLNGRHGPPDDVVQLDPATRTGWTFGPYDTQIQQFTY